MATYVTRAIEVAGQNISFIRLPVKVLSSVAGLEHTTGYSIATKERAFLDRIYVSHDYHFDHLDTLDWNKVFEILPIYQNKRLVKKVNEYFKHYGQ